MNGIEVGGMDTKSGGGGVVVDGEEESGLIEMSIEDFVESMGEAGCCGKDAYEDHGDVQTAVVVVLQSSLRLRCGRYPSRPNVDKRAHNPLTTVEISIFLLLSWSLPRVRLPLLNW